MDLFFSEIRYGGESASYLAVDIFPKDLELKRKFYMQKIANLMSSDSIIQVPELSIGRITISFVKHNAVVLPLIWEVQPSPLWRTTQEKEKYKVNNWRKDVSRALARFFINEGFSDLLARSEESIKNHQKFSSSEADQKTMTELNYGQFAKVKNVIFPRDVRDYRKTFSNRDLWNRAEADRFHTYSEKLGKFIPRDEVLHSYTKPDISLQNKGTRNYRFEEVTGKKGSRLIVVFENEKRNLKYSFEINKVLRGLANTSNINDLLNKSHLSVDDVTGLFMKNNSSLFIPSYGKPVTLNPINEAA